MTRDQSLDIGAQLAGADQQDLGPGARVPKICGSMKRCLTIGILTK
jgi:hypothetical protein